MLSVLVLDAAASPEVAAVVREAVAGALGSLELPEGAGLTVVLAGDALLAELNEAHRGLAGPTDVLSFPADPADAEPGEDPYLGDVLISVDRAGASAAQAGHGLVDELRLLAVHGLLHLVGFEDETDAGAAAMLRREVALGVRRPEDLPEGFEL